MLSRIYFQTSGQFFFFLIYLFILFYFFIYFFWEGERREFNSAGT
jgi:cbb3-type cytochrome oxidase subunit 3